MIKDEGMMMKGKSIRVNVMEETVGRMKKRGIVERITAINRREEPSAKL